jgi:hypothetical protein
LSDPMKKDPFAKTGSGQRNEGHCISAARKRKFTFRKASMTCPAFPHSPTNLSDRCLEPVLVIFGNIVLVILNCTRSPPKTSIHRVAMVLQY